MIKAKTSENSSYAVRLLDGSETHVGKRVYDIYEKAVYALSLAVRYLRPDHEESAERENAISLLRSMADPEDCFNSVLTAYAHKNNSEIFITANALGMFSYVSEALREGEDPADVLDRAFAVALDYLGKFCLFGQDESQSVFREIEEVFTESLSAGLIGVHFSIIEPDLYEAYTAQYQSGVDGVVESELDKRQLSFDDEGKPGFYLRRDQVDPTLMAFLERMSAASDHFIEQAILVIHPDLKDLDQREQAEAEALRKMRFGRPENFVDLSQIPRHLATPSLKGYEAALTGYTGGNAYIKALEDATFLTDKVFTDGYLTLKNRNDIRFRYEDIKTKKTISSDDLDIPLLHGVYSVVVLCAEKIVGNQIVVKRSQLGDYLGVKTSQGNAYPIIAKLKQFESLIGVIDDGKGSFYRLLSVSSYDGVSDLITLDCGFMLKLIHSIKEDSGKIVSRKGQMIEAQMPSANFLMHSASVNEKNKPAWQLHMLILDLMLQTGDKGSPRIKYSTLIEKVPQLHGTLEAQKYTQAKNTILKRAFKGAYEILLTKSDACKYWKDLSINGQLLTKDNLNKILPPTYSAIKKGETLKIKHSGVNQDRKPSV